MKKILKLTGLLALLFGLMVSCDPKPVDEPKPEPETLNAPTSLKTGTLTATTASLSWAGVDGAEKYNVEIGDMDAVETSEASYEATGLSAETEYIWRVQAVKGDIVSDWATGPTFTTPEKGGTEVTPTAPPTSLTVSDVTESGALLEWQHADADSHEVVLNGGEPIPVTEPNYQATGLTPETNYTWKVRSSKDGVWSEWADGEPFTTEVGFSTVKLELFNDGVQYLGDYYFGPGTENILMNFISVDPYGDILNFTQIVLDFITVPMDKHPTIDILDIPTGTYEINDSRSTNSIALGDHTYVQSIVGGFPVGRWAITGGTVTVEGDHTGYNMTFTLLLEGGQILAELNGTIPLENPDYQAGYGDVIDFGTLSYIQRAEHFPNVYGNSKVDGWMISAATDAGVLQTGGEDGWYLMSQIHTLLNSGKPIRNGEYEIYDAQLPWSAVPGGNNQNGPYGTWLVRMENGKSTDMYALTSGKLISSYADGTYTIEVDAFTADGTNVIGTIQGAAPSDTSAVSFNNTFYIR